MDSCEGKQWINEDDLTAAKLDKEYLVNNIDAMILKKRKTEER